MKRLVVIDDEPIVVTGIKAMIARIGTDYSVVGHAYDGIEGLAVIQRNVPDLVITDIRMPGLDGLRLIEHCKESLPQTDFVVISGYQEFEYARRALALGVKDYIDKPITLDKLSELFLRLNSTPKPAYAVATQMGPDKLDDFIYCLRHEKKENINAAFEEILLEYRKNTETFQQYRSEIYKVICVSIGVFFEQHRIYDIDKYFPNYRNLELLTNYEETNIYSRALINRIVEKLDFLNLGNLHRTVAKLVEFINQNYDKNIGLNEFADMVSMSPAYLSILFKEEIGISYIKYLTKVRLDHAKKLLLDGEKVLAVSQKIGYQDYRYFCNIFKKNVGQTPNEYRHYGKQN